MLLDQRESNQKLHPDIKDAANEYLELVSDKPLEKATIRPKKMPPGFRKENSAGRRGRPGVLSRGGSLSRGRGRGRTAAPRTAHIQKPPRPAFHVDAFKGEHSEEESESDTPPRELHLEKQDKPKPGNDRFSFRERTTPRDGPATPRTVANRFSQFSRDKRETVKRPASTRSLTQTSSDKPARSPSDFYALKKDPTRKKEFDPIAGLMKEMDPKQSQDSLTSKDMEPMSSRTSSTGFPSKTLPPKPTTVSKEVKVGVTLGTADKDILKHPDYTEIYPKETFRSLLCRLLKRSDFASIPQLRDLDGNELTSTFDDEIIENLPKNIWFDIEAFPDAEEERRKQLLEVDEQRKKMVQEFETEKQQWLESLEKNQALWREKFEEQQSEREQQFLETQTRWANQQQHKFLEELGNERAELTRQIKAYREKRKELEKRSSLASLTEMKEKDEKIKRLQEGLTRSSSRVAEVKKENEHERIELNRIRASFSDLEAKYSALRKLQESVEHAVDIEERYKKKIKEMKINYDQKLKTSETRFSKKEEYVELLLKSMRKAQDKNQELLKENSELRKKKNKKVSTYAASSYAAPLKQPKRFVNQQSKHITSRVPSLDSPSLPLSSEEENLWEKAARKGKKKKKGKPMSMIPAVKKAKSPTPWGAVARPKATPISAQLQKARKSPRVVPQRATRQMRAKNPTAASGKSKPRMVMKPQQSANFDDSWNTVSGKKAAKQPAPKKAFEKQFKGTNSFNFQNPPKKKKKGNRSG